MHLLLRRTDDYSLKFYFFLFLFTRLGDVMYFRSSSLYDKRKQPSPNSRYVKFLINLHPNVNFNFLNIVVILIIDL